MAAWGSSFEEVVAWMGAGERWRGCGGRRVRHASFGGVEQEMGIEREREAADLILIPGWSCGRSC
jgi:hypothetical protein